MRSTRLCSLAILAALLFTSFKSVSVATQAVTSTQNPLDQLRDTVKGFLDSAGLPFTTDQDRAIALMMEDRRRASEELFGQMMDFRAGPVQGQEMDRAVAAIRWMYDEFKKQLRAYLTPEQLVVWDKYQSQGGIGALKRILSEAGNPLTAENERRAELLYSNLSADSETSAYSSIEDILSPEQRGAVVQANQRAAPSNGSGTRQAADGQAVAVALRGLDRCVD